MNIFLVGYMGSGKTTLGKQLAQALDYSFVDQDSVIEEKMGMTIADIFSLMGEPKFREIEHQTLADLSNGDNMVVATGGGAPCYFDNMELMNKGGVSIYLKVSTQTLFQRLRLAHLKRPLIRNKSDKELVAFIDSKMIEREPFYSKSTITIQSDDILLSDIQNALREYPKK
jgi:shikimate kinase